jgi:putative ABC transport system permease protein
MLVGAVAGLCTGIIHVRFKVRDLLSGIITMTALFSINLQIAGSNMVVDRGTLTVFTSAPVMALFGGTSLIVRKLIVALLLAIAVKILLDLFFRTRSGMLLRAAGDNATLVTTLAKNTGSMKILGLVIANALVALAGSVVCQEQRAFSATMGTGQMVFGLAAVIIGTTACRRLSFVKGTTAAILGSVIYKICIQVAISLGLPANLMKLATAVLFLVILVLGTQRRERARKGAAANA